MFKIETDSYKGSGTLFNNKINKNLIQQICYNVHIQYCCYIFVKEFVGFMLGLGFPS